MSPERIKSIRNHMIIASLLLLIVGVAFIVWPDEAARVMARAIAIAIIGFSVFELVLFFFGKRKGFVDVSAIVTGVLLMALGVYLLVKPESLLNLFNIIFGIVILIIGVDHVFQSIFIIRHIRSLWWISLLVGILAIAMGILTLVNPFSAIRTAMIIIGITMIVEAIGGFWNLPALKARPSAAPIDVTPSNNIGDEDINA